MISDFVKYNKESFKLIFTKPVLLLIGIFEMLILYVVSTIILDIFYTGRIGSDFNLIIAVTLSVLSIFLQAGKLNVIKEGIVSGVFKIKDFIRGIKKYFIKLVVARLLALLYIFVIGLIIGAIGMFLATFSINLYFTFGLLFVMFTVLYAFIKMIDTILVYEDCSPVGAVNKSINFAQSNFVVVYTLNLFNVFFTNSYNRMTMYKEYGVVPFFMTFGKNPLTTNLMIVGGIIALFTQLYFEIAFFQLYNERA